jgi:hypothetical protein
MADADIEESEVAARAATAASTRPTLEPTTAATTAADGDKPGIPISTTRGNVVYGTRRCLDLDIEIGVVNLLPASLTEELPSHQ